MATPIALPSIQLKVFKPDVSRYHANRLARIRAIGERAQQDKIRKEAYKRSLAKEFNEINVDKYKFTTEYFQEQQVKLMDDFSSWSARQQAQEGKALSGQSLRVATKYASDIDKKIDRMAFSERSFKSDGKFVADNITDIDIDFYKAYTSYDPRKDGFYNDYLKKNNVKPSLREMSGSEVSEEMNRKYYKNDRLDERHQTYLNKHGDVVEDITKFVEKAYILNEEGYPIAPNTKWQFNESSDILMSNTKWQVGIMNEYEGLKDKNQKKFYENLALKKQLSSYNGYYDTDFSKVNKEGEVGDIMDAYKYYYYDKYGDNSYALNKNIKLKDKALKEEKDKFIGGFSRVNGKIVIGSTSPTTVTYKSGETSEGYYQLGAVSKKGQTGNLVDVVDISGEGSPVQGTLNAADYQNYDLVGFDLDYRGIPMAHIRVSFKDSPLYEKGKPVYRSVQGYSGTLEKIKQDVNNSNMKDKHKTKKINSIEKEITADESGKLIKKTTRRKDMLIPVNKNPGIVSGYSIDPSLFVGDKEFDLSLIDVANSSEEDKAAVQWIKDNPEDPRAKKIYNSLISK